MRAPGAALAGEVSGLRHLGESDRSPGSGRVLPGGDGPGPGGRAGRPCGSRPHRRDRAPAGADGERRAGPRLGRRPGPGLGDPGGRGAGRGEIHAPAPGRWRPGPAGVDPPVRLRRRVPGPGQRAGAPPRRRCPRALPRLRDLPGRHPGAHRRPQTGRGRGGLDPDDLESRPRVRRRQPEPGPRGGGPAPGGGQTPGGEHVAHRPHHQGGQPGGPQGPGAHRGHGRLLRGRPAAGLPDPPGHEESLRSHR